MSRTREGYEEGEKVMTLSRKNSLYIAGAGTGKTTTLIKHFVSLLQQGIAPEKLAVITFTEAATFELIERIRRELPDADISAATITTIHGFCSQLLRESPVEARVSPNFEVMDGIGREILLEKLWDSWIEGQLDCEGPIAEQRIAGATRESLRDLAFDILNHRDRIEEIPASAKLLKALAGFVEYYAQAKKERGVLDFDDLLLKTRKLLCENRELLERFRSRYEQILVDEFQDTDPLQAQIIWLLTTEGEPCDNWWELSPAKGRIFVVGDPKQSIYRFRRADVALFEQCAQSIERGDPGAKQDLLLNQRSVPKILDWVNWVSGTKLQARRSDSEFAEGGVRLLLPQVSLEGKSMDEARREEARAIALFLRDHRGKIPYRDCGILFKTFSSLEIYEEALVQAGVPFVVEGGKSYFKRREVRLLISWLRAIDNPQDEIALLAVLRSSLYGVSDEELAQYVAAGGEWNYNKGTRSNRVPVETLQYALENLQSWHSRRHQYSIPDLLERFYEESGILGQCLLQPAGEQRVANLLQIVRLARELESREPLSFSSFVQYLSESESKLREEAQPNISEGGDAVHLLTMHKSKGLAFHLVILADLARGKGTHSKPLIYRRSKRTFEYALNKDLRSTEHEDAKQEEELAEAEESHRLFYVAATRARDLLVIPRFPSGTRKLDSNSLLALLPAEVRDFDAQSSVSELRGMQVLKIDTSELTELSKQKESKELDRKLKERKEFLEEKKKRIEMRKPLLQWISPSKLKEENEPLPLDLELKQGAGAKTGTVVHRVLARFSWGSREIPEALFKAESQSLNLDANEEQHARKCLENALCSSLWKRASESKRRYREIPFLMQSETGFVSGSIDLLFEEKGKWILVDYKTDSVNKDQAASRAENYRAQLSLYSQAVGRFLKAKPEEVCLSFLFGGIETVLSGTR